MQKEKILVVGKNGQLGSALIKLAKEKTCELGDIPKYLENFEIKGFGSKELDITKKEEVIEIIKKENPKAIVNCAAYTDVDGCEDNIDTAFLVNALGPRNLAIAAEEVKAKLIHISTDYVFDGEEEKKRVEFDLINPKSIYGKSKALGEEYVKNFCSRFFILRTSWLYGENGNNFVKTIVRVAKEKGELKVVDDQIGSPTNVLDLSFVILKLLETEEYGIYHCSGNKQCSWYEFAVSIVKHFGVDAKVFPCSTDEFKRKAKRPKFSTLENLMLKITVGDYFRDWEDALISFAKKNKNIF